MKGLFGGLVVEAANEDGCFLAGLVGHFVFMQIAGLSVILHLRFGVVDMQLSHVRQLFQALAKHLMSTFRVAFPH